MTPAFQLMNINLSKNDIEDLIKPEGLLAQEVVKFEDYGKLLIKADWEWYLQKLMKTEIVLWCKWA